MIVRALLTALLATLMAASNSPADAATRRLEGRTVVVGDSIVAGYGTTRPERRNSYPARLQARLGQRIPIVKHPAGCLVAAGCFYGPSMMDTYADEVLAARPSRVLLSMGVNDLCHLADPDLRAGYRAVLATNRANGIQTVFATITPQNDNWPWRCEEQRVRINAWLLDTFPGRTIDVAAPLENAAGNLRDRYDSGDGLHPNNAGADRIAATMARWLKASACGAQGFPVPLPR